MAGNIKAAIIEARAEPQPDGSYNVHLDMKCLSQQMHDVARARLSALFEELMGMCDMTIVAGSHEELARKMNDRAGVKTGDA